MRHDRMRRITPYVWLGLRRPADRQRRRQRISARGARRRRRRPRASTARGVWLFAAPALLVPAVVFLLGPHTIFSNNAAEFAVVVRRTGGAAAPANGRRQLDHPACRRMRHRGALRAADADVRGAAVRAWPAAVGPGQPVECGLRRARRSGSRPERARMARAVRACGVGGRAAPRARVFSARQPDRAVRLARVPGRSGSPRSSCQHRVRRPHSACVGSNRLPRSTSSRRTGTSSTSSSTSSSRTCSTTFFSRIARRSIASSAAFSISPITPARFRRHRSACRPCWRARNTGMKSRLPSSCAKRSSRARFSRRSREAGYDVDATHDCACRFVRAMDGTGGGAELEGCAVPDSQAFREPGRLPRSLRAAAARAVAVPPRAARGKGVQRRAAGCVLSTDLDGSSRVAGTGETPRGEQFGGIPRAVHRLDDRRTRSSCLQAAARRRASPSDRGRSRMPIHRHHGHVAAELHGAITLRPEARRRRCSIARGRSASTTAASSSCRPIMAPICSRSGSAAGVKACLSFPDLRPCDCRRLPRQRKP